MNRILLITSFLFFYVFTNAQEKLNYSNVVKVENTSKDELYSRAMNWFVNSFRDANNVIQLSDKDNGQITAKALFVYNPNFFVGSGPVKGFIRYTLSIYVKDGRYKYEITDFTHDASGSPNSRSVGVITTADGYPGIEKRTANQKWMNNTWKDIKEQIDLIVSPIEKSIETGMLKNANVQNEDW